MRRKHCVQRLGKKKTSLLRGAVYGGRVAISKNQDKEGDWQKGTNHEPWSELGPAIKKGNGKIYTQRLMGIEGVAICEEKNRQGLGQNAHWL